LNIAVLNVGNFLSAKGYNRQFIEELSEQLAANEFTVIRTSAVESKPLRLLDMMRTMVFARGRYDVIHVTLYSGRAFFWGAAAVVLGGMLRRPLVLSLHGGNLPEFAKRWRRSVRAVLTAPAAVVAPSEYLRSAFHSDRADIRVIRNPIHLERYIPSERTTARPQLVWLRAFHAIYNPALAVRIVAALAQRYPEVRLVMVGPDMGDGSLESAKGLAKTLGVENNVVFRDAVPHVEVPEVLSSADIFLNTAAVDNTPISVLEAMACALCVVSTAVGGIPYLVEDGRNGLLYPGGDAVAGAARVAQILDDTTLAASLRRNARSTAEACDWPRVLNEWKTLLSAVARRAA
jgi:glycosyltransferase involved in cell wall biosynthesis